MKGAPRLIQSKGLKCKKTALMQVREARKKNTAVADSLFFSYNFLTISAALPLVSGANVTDWKNFICAPKLLRLASLAEAKFHSFTLIRPNKRPISQLCPAKPWCKGFFFFVFCFSSSAAS